VWLETTSFMNIIVIMTSSLQGSILHAVESARRKMRWCSKNKMVFYKNLIASSCPSNREIWSFCCHPERECLVCIGMRVLSMLFWMYLDLAKSINRLSCNSVQALSSDISPNLNNLQFSVIPDKLSTAWLWMIHLSFSESCAAITPLPEFQRPQT
jgi:hypothetical protein